MLLSFFFAGFLSLQQTLPAHISFVRLLHYEHSKCNKSIRSNKVHFLLYISRFWKDSQLFLRPILDVLGIFVMFSVRERLRFYAYVNGVTQHFPTLFISRLDLYHRNLNNWRQFGNLIVKVCTRTYKVLSRNTVSSTHSLNYHHFNLQAIVGACSYTVYGLALCIKNHWPAFAFKL